MMQDGLSLAMYIHNSADDGIAKKTPVTVSAGS